MELTLIATAVWVLLLGLSIAVALPPREDAYRDSSEESH